MNPHTTTYRVSFSPSDRNVSDDECMEPIYCDSMDGAMRAIAQDALETALMHGAAGEEHERSAYLRTLHETAVTAYPAHGVTAWPVEVTTGDNPRMIGSYMTYPCAADTSEQYAESIHAWTPGDVIAADDPFLAPYDPDA